uniref:CCHC-type domain-containing protein n=1 Tax=Trichuris muris TaxID=70415 RepID=A0A5S6R1E0_TRIMR
MTTTNGCVLPPTFRDGDFQLWIKRFEICADANCWNSQTRALRLPTLLDGEAFMVYNSLEAETRGSYTELKRALCSALQPGAGEAPAYAAFERRRMEPGETVRQFVYSLRLLCERAFPNVSSRAREAILMRRFESGIPEKYGRMLMSGPRLHCLEDAVERTQQLIAIDQQFPEHTVASAVNGNENWMEMERKLNEISTRLDHLMMESPCELGGSAALQRRLPNVGRRRYRGGRGPQCWNCGRYGHVARVCRTDGQGPLPSGGRDARQVGWLNDRGPDVMAPRPVRSSKWGH